MVLRVWPYEVERGISPGDAQRHCVQHAEWQKVRLSMKGLPTTEKLDTLHNWYKHGTCLLTDGSYAKEVSLFIRKLQITNYLGALRRGGQLDDNNRVKKEL